MTFTDPDLVHEPADDAPVPAAWGAAVRDDLEALADPPEASVFATAPQLVNPQGFGEPFGDVLAAPGTHHDSRGMHDEAEENSRIHVTEPGNYLAVAAANFQGVPPTGYRVIVDFLVNGTQIVTGDARFYAAGTTFHGVTAERTLDLSAGDYVEVMAQHNAGEEREVTLKEFTLAWTGVSL